MIVALALAGYAAVTRAVDSIVDADTDTVKSAIDEEEIKSAIDENGLTAVGKMETLEAAINEDELDTAIDLERVQALVEEQTDAYEPPIDTEELRSSIDLGAAIDIQQIKSAVDLDAAVDLDRIQTAIGEQADDASNDMDSTTGTDIPVEREGNR